MPVSLVVFSPIIWSPEKIVEGIHESLQNLKCLPEVQNDGKLIFDGLAKVDGESVKIRTILDKSNVTISSYSIVKGA